MTFARNPAHVRARPSRVRCTRGWAIALARQTTSRPLPAQALPWRARPFAAKRGLGLPTCPRPAQAMGEPVHLAPPAPHGLHNTGPLVRRGPAQPAPRPHLWRPRPRDAVASNGGKARLGMVRSPYPTPGQLPTGGRRARPRRRPSRHAAPARPALWPPLPPAPTRTPTANRSPGFAKAGDGPARCPRLRLGLRRPTGPSSGKVPWCLANSLACFSSTSRARLSAATRANALVSSSHHHRPTMASAARRVCPTTRRATLLCLKTATGTPRRSRVRCTRG